MTIEPKTELDLLREQAEHCRILLTAMVKNEGQSRVLDANIRHKRDQLQDLEERIRALEEAEA